MRTSTYITITVRKHIKDFLLREYGVPGEDFIRVHQNTFLGKTVMMAIEKLPYRQGQEKKPSLEKNMAHLHILLPKKIKHYSILPEKRKCLADFFEKDFQRNFIFFIKGQVAATGNELGSIKMFMKMYEVDSECYDIDVARKCWRDYKDRIYKINNNGFGAAA